MKTNCDDEKKIDIMINSLTNTRVYIFENMKFSELLGRNVMEYFIGSMMATKKKENGTTKSR